MSTNAEHQSRNEILAEMERARTDVMPRKATVRLIREAIARTEREVSDPLGTTGLFGIGMRGIKDKRGSQPTHEEFARELRENARARLQQMRGLL